MSTEDKIYEIVRTTKYVHYGTVVDIFHTLTEGRSNGEMIAFLALLVNELNDEFNKRMDLEYGGGKIDQIIADYYGESETGEQS